MLRTPQMLCALMGFMAPAALASAGDCELASQWAVCAKEAEILGHISQREASKTTLQQASVLLTVYAVAACGEAQTLRQQALTESAFTRAFAKQQSTAQRDAFYAQWKAGAEARAEQCSRSFTEHAARFREQVKAAGAARKPGAE